MMRRIIVLDTTLRDGEQVPGAKLNLYEKLEIARQLKNLNVDIIEAGFPASSAGDFKAVAEIAKKLGDKVMITALARAVKSDIDAVYNSVKYAREPLIHIVLGTSDVHVEKKLRKTREQILAQGVEAVRYAKSLCPNVQYSTEDASRSDFDYLWETIEAVVKAGATMINIPDTVGYAVPEEFGDLIRRINERLKNLNPDVILSVHCHNDTGLATANTLAAIKNGADKVECTINGIGERAGNAALEEVVMGLVVRKEYYQATTGIKTTEIKKTSNLVSALMGLDVQVNKAITGDNAFAHSSGIHQDGLLKSRDAYEIIHPEDVGVENMEIILTARSGRHAVKNALAQVGFNDFTNEEFEQVFAKFLELADAKKEVYNHDLYHIVQSTIRRDNSDDQGIKDLYELVDMQVIANNNFPSASVKIKKGNDMLMSSSVGNGAVDALYSAIRDATGIELSLLEYKLNSISRGKEALGRVSIKVSHNGKNYTSKAVDTDILKASALAFVNAVNMAVVEEIVSKREQAI
ncbi:MAG TPA: 2-isopropylmalate synthase [Clostridiaceae bacterium]|nr:2-isopropylmalate synthase [Clostridiaceae bacterium]